LAINYLSQSQSWVLTTRQTAYVFRVANDGKWLQHIYWGSKLAYEKDYINPLLTQTRGKTLAEAGVADEFAVQGVVRWQEPSVQAVFTDGGRQVILQYSSFNVQPNAAGREELIVILQDSFYPLQVNLHYEVIEEADVIVRSAHFKNLGTTPIRLEQALSATWHLPLSQTGETYRLSHLVGSWMAEFQLRRTKLTQGNVVLESRQGYTSHSANPWFALDRGQAGEERGEVWYGALGWSGNWKVVIQTTVAGRTCVSGGVNNFDFEWYLAANETFSTPSFVAGYTNEGFGQASRNLHRYTLGYILPTAHASKIRPVLYNAWEVHQFEVNEQNQMALVERAAELGAELFVVDDGWFGNGNFSRNSDHAGLGDWVVDTEKFPHGFRPIIERVKALGMNFGLWVEPEMVNPNSQLYEQHPEWVYHFPHRERRTSRNQLVLNLSRPDVCEYIYDFMDRLLTENEISFIKWDFNRPITDGGSPDTPLTRQREVWVRHVQNLYQILARLRQKYPQVVFESCAGGGGRVDLGILKYSDQVWTSDNTDAWERLFIQEGFSQVYPTKTMMAWVTDAPNSLTKRILPIEYRCHSAMCGVLSLGGNLNTWSEADFTKARELVQQYKQIRHIIQEGELYRLRSSQTGVAAFQYVSRDKTEAVVLVFCDIQRHLDDLPYLHLRGLSETALYNYNIENRTKNTSISASSGLLLMQSGLPLQLESDFTSCLITLRQV
jgi:alpha-galactosidase